MKTPSTNGQTADGKFTHGNKLGRGNPFAAQVNRLRSAMLQAVSDDDMAAVVAKLIELSKGGDVKAIDLLLNRILGKVDTFRLDDEINEEARNRVLSLLAGGGKRESA